MSATRILLVEDDLDNRRIMVHRLQKIGGFEILEAGDGEEALKIVQTPPPPNIILMDLKLPVMDGWEATKRIRQIEGCRNIPIIAVTAQTMAGDELKALAAGCDDYVAKPVVLKSLEGKMRRLLSR